MMAWPAMPELPPRLAALDIARRTGVAWGSLTDLKPAVTNWPLPLTDPYPETNDALAARIASLENTLEKFLKREAISLVVIAQRFPGRSQAQLASAYGLDGAVRSECWRAGVQLRWQPESTVRKEMLGRGRGSTALMKRLAMRWCAVQGIAVRCDDEADAAVLWRWTRDETVRQWMRTNGRHADGQSGQEPLRSFVAATAGEYSGGASATRGDLRE
jgi:Holliday junction resolvasome RuvABC endonuclease subunit